MDTAYAALYDISILVNTPAQTTTSGTRDITNREVEYGVGDLYKVDISKLTFTYQDLSYSQTRCHSCR